MKIWWVPVFAGLLVTGCSSPEPTAATAKSPGPKITQLYAPESSVAVGEKAKICYGVENARTVWISPPRLELSAALARCIEVEPTAKTTYTLTVEGADGRQVSQDVSIGIGPAKVKIVNVNISAVQVKPGEMVQICYTTENARSVTIDPPGFRGSDAKGCASHQPVSTTTYVIVATGAAGDRDEERVTVKVR